MQVHDSVTFEVPDEMLPVALPTIKTIMEDFDFVPHVGVDIEYGKSWGLFQKWDGKSPVAVPRDENIRQVLVPNPEDEANGSQRRTSEGVCNDNSS